MNKLEIINATGRKVTRLSVPQWQGDVYLRSWSVKERQDFQVELDNPTPDLFALVAVKSLCDEAGQLLFQEDEAALLQDKDLHALRLIAETALQVGTVDDAKKN